MLLYLNAGSVLALNSLGFLFSIHSRSFIGHDGDTLGTHGSLMPFKLDTVKGSIELKSAIKGCSLDYDSGHPRVEINNKGEIRIKVGRGCEAIRNGRLITERCSRSGRQKFLWVPTSLFDRGGGGMYGNPQYKEIYRRTMDLDRRLRGVRDGSSSDERSGQYFPRRRKHSRRRPNGLLDSSSSENDGQERAWLSGCKPGGPGRSIGMLEKKLGAFDDLYKKFTGLAGNHKRERGIYAYGLDPVEGCECKKECMRNPANGQCYFRLDGQGNIYPLWKPCRCQPKEDLCSLKNAIDRKMCELTFRNDFSEFSRYLDHELGG